MAERERSGESAVGMHEWKANVRPPARARDPCLRRGVRPEAGWSLRVPVQPRHRKCLVLRQPPATAADTAVEVVAWGEEASEAVEPRWRSCRNIRMRKGSDDCRSTRSRKRAGRPHPGGAAGGFRWRPAAHGAAADSIQICSPRDGRLTFERCDLSRLHRDLGGERGKPGLTHLDTHAARRALALRAVGRCPASASAGRR